MGRKTSSWASVGTGLYDKEEEHNEKPNTKKMDQVKAVASTGLDKAKSAATVGAQKVKKETASGFKWVKDKCSSFK